MQTHTCRARVEIKREKQRECGADRLNPAIVLSRQRGVNLAGEGDDLLKAAARPIAGEFSRLVWIHQPSSKLSGVCVKCAVRICCTYCQMQINTFDCPPRLT